MLIWQLRTLCADWRLHLLRAVYAGPTLFAWPETQGGSMVREVQTNRRTTATALALMLAVPFAHAGDDPLERPARTSAPLELPHATEVAMAEKARKRDRKPGNIERHDFLVLSASLKPVTWPKNTDIRQRLLTSELKATPVVGWIAENLYRSKNDAGWCVEADPGEGEYMVFYRYHPKK
jgi:hypothetical protein